jgi:acetyl esterase/lipase
MKKVTTILAFFLALATSFGDGGKSDSSEEFRTLTGESATAGNIVDEDGRIRNVVTPLLHLFRTAAPAPVGTVLLLPGGAYKHLSAVKEGANTARLLNVRGFDAVLLEYPVAAGPDTRELALAATLKAYRLIQTNPSALGLQSGRLGIMGYSAGGHLAARTAQNLTSAEQPTDLILIYPAYLDETRPGSALPLVTPPAGNPGRLFVLIAANDKEVWVKSSRAFADAWQAAQGTVSYHLLADGGHGFGLAGEGPDAAKDWPQLLGKFLGPQP